MTMPMQQAVKQVEEAAFRAEEEVFAVREAIKAYRAAEDQPAATLEEITRQCLDVIALMNAPDPI